MTVPSRSFGRTLDASHDIARVAAHDPVDDRAADPSREAS